MTYSLIDRKFIVIRGHHYTSRFILDLCIFLRQKKRPSPDGLFYQSKFRARSSHSGKVTASGVTTLQKPLHPGGFNWRYCWQLPPLLPFFGVRLFEKVPA
jgi:hypothetical protein